MRALIATEPGKPGRENEDWAGATPTVIVLLDGLSSAPGAESPCHHGTPWFVEQLGSQLLSIAGNPAHSLRASLAIAIRDVAALHPECEGNVDGAPSATVAALRMLSDNSADYLILADARIVIETNDGVRVITDERVEQVAQEEKAAALRQRIGSNEQRQAVAELIATQKPLRNHPDGYWIAAGDPVAARHALTGAVPGESIRRVVLMSDGASRIVDVFGMHTWAEALDVVDSHGPHELIRRVREVEATDPDGVRWPRYKMGDDATVAFASWAPSA
ncbi:MAG: protein phosphatase 2C domain-containing protein [Pseudonocardia sp.]